MYVGIQQATFQQPAMQRYYYYYYYYYYYWPAAATTASAKHDAWFVFIFATMTADERVRSQAAAAAAGKITAVNAHFRDVVDRICSAKSSDGGGVINAFERWFDSNWLVVEKYS